MPVSSGGDEMPWILFHLPRRSEASSLWLDFVSPPAVLPASPEARDPLDCSPPGSSVHGTVQGCHSLLQGIFLTQGLNLHFLCLLHCKRILYTLGLQMGLKSFSTNLVARKQSPWIIWPPGSCWLLSVITAHPNSVSFPLEAGLGQMLAW